MSETPPGISLDVMNVYGEKNPKGVRVGDAPKDIPFNEKYGKANPQDHYGCNYGDGTECK